MFQIDTSIIIRELERSINLFKPETTLLITLLIGIIVDVVFKKVRNIVGYLSLVGFIISFIFLFYLPNESQPSFFAMIVVDPFSLFFKQIILISSIIVIVLSLFSKELQDSKHNLGEYYIFITGMAFGMFLLSGATNLVMIYLAIETMSISSYILTGYTKEVQRSSEASLKYVIFGAVSSALMIYGISILYGLTGTLNLFGISDMLNRANISVIPLMISGLLILAGLGYKISAVPFHFWTPDVYEGAPITITAFLSVASKAAGFAVLIRFLKITFVDFSAPLQVEAWSILKGIDWTLIIAILSVLTMTVGNVVALWQTNLKRLLAYSSIAHAGYILMGLVVFNDTGLTAILVYIIVYLIMNFGAFLVVMLVANKIGSEEIDDYNGLAYRSPFIAVCFAIFLVSLTGLPPTAGFIGKLYLFAALIKTNYIWLAIIGILNSVIGLYYYAKVFRNMYIRETDFDKTKTIEFSPVIKLLLLVFAIPSILFGLYFTPIVNWAQASIKIFGIQ
ncbi:MAG TPA: NADH-quinone oxidoreductase subunit N [Bacteroidota bacterium]|jgi:NADH-quinone oxidoreductase subunit N|nr:NADH-quinone oxidoreductase subunit N [Bacteroidota bacterium]